MPKTAFKFFSIDHFWIIGSALLTTNLITSELALMRYAGIAIVVYGVLMINRRVLDLHAEIQERLK